jgi:hypothetical protein
VCLNPYLFCGCLQCNKIFKYIRYYRVAHCILCKEAKRIIYGLVLYWAVVDELVPRSQTMLQLSHHRHMAIWDGDALL